MIKKEESPYGIFSSTPELASAEKFVEHYVLAFEIAKNLELVEREELTEQIKATVSEALNPDADTAEVLAVSALTAKARDRELRRPLVKTEKELKKEDHKLWPPFSIKRIKKINGLLEEKTEILKDQTECEKAQILYIMELRALKQNINSKA